MANEYEPNPEWVEARYEVACFDKDGMRVIAFDRIQDGPIRLKELDGALVIVPKYKKKEQSHGTT